MALRSRFAGLAVATGLLVSLQLTAAPPAPRVLGLPQSSAAAPSPGLVISEVLFDPLAGAPPYVELLNAGKAPVNLSRTALRVGERLVLLARVQTPLAAGSRLLVRFDGATATEPGVHHARADVPFAAEAGTVALLDEENEIVDQVSWGTAPGAVSYGAGGVAPDSLAPGSSIGRPPGALRPRRPLDWVAYPPAQTTPGAANPLPAVAEMLISSGVIVTEPTITLAWYAVPGATDYRVQVAADAAFGSVRVDQVVTAPAYRAGPFPAGQYYWRVQARRSGVSAAFSRTSVVVLRPEASAGGWNRDILLRPFFSQTPPTAAQPLPTVMLPVPHVIQHKDTRLLQLENPVESGAHAWDVDHGTLDRADPADAGNCLLASTAMINHFYKGDLRQDRLAYEALGPHAITYLPRLRAAGHSISPSMLAEQQQGPEWDFVYGSGLSVKRALAALTFALGLPPQVERLFDGNPNFMWNFVRSELDAGLASWIFMPFRGAIGRRQETSVTTDTDGDGVMDFDEIERFRTDPLQIDTDEDGVDDYEDIYSGVFHNVFGYAYSPTTPSKGRDFDGDGLPTERDRDSDNGGCLDGGEDANGNGKRDGAETGNFDYADDRCGELQGAITWSIVLEVSAGIQTNIRREDGIVHVKLRAPDRSDPDRFEDDGSTYYFRAIEHLTVSNPGCPLTARAPVFGGGAFTGEGASIAGMIADVLRPGTPSIPAGGQRAASGAGRGTASARVPRQLTVGATGPGRGVGSNEDCVTSEEGPIDGSFALPDCPGTQDPNDPRTFRFNCSQPTEPPTAPLRILFFRVSGTVRLP